MHLCVVGKLKCADNAAQVLKVLSDLLGHDNQEVSDVVYQTSKQAVLCNVTNMSGMKAFCIHCMFVADCTCNLNKDMLKIGHRMVLESSIC